MCVTWPIYVHDMNHSYVCHASLQHAATCSERRIMYVSSLLKCSTLCNTLHHTASHCNTLQHIAIHCNTLQHTATHCSRERRIQYISRWAHTELTATHCNTLQHTATHCNTLQQGEEYHAYLEMGTHRAYRALLGEGGACVGVRVYLCT
jgi:hypothetical protein